MTDWTARAQAFFSNEATPCTDETDTNTVSSAPSPALFAAADRACDHWNDSPAAREQMRQDIHDTPAHLRAELLEHLQAAYPKDKK